MAYNGKAETVQEAFEWQRAFIKGFEGKMKEEYIKKINELLSAIDDIWTLNEILRCIENITK